MCILPPVFGRENQSKECQEFLSCWTYMGQERKRTCERQRKCRMGIAICPFDWAANKKQCGCKIKELQSKYLPWIKLEVVLWCSFQIPIQSK